MALSHNSILAIVDLAIYLFLTPFIYYLWYRHGRHGILGYLFLSVAAMLRIVADIIQLAENSSNGTPTLGGAIVGMVGLSPLLLAASGFLHEAHHYVITGITRSGSSEKQAMLRLRLFAILIHVASVTGIVLIVIGTVDIVPPKTSSEIHSGNGLREAGAIVLLCVWLALALYNLWLIHSSIALESLLDREVRQLAIWTFIGVIFVAVRVIYEVVYTFDTTNGNFSPSLGSFAVKVILIDADEVLAILFFTIAGWQSRTITKSQIPPPTRRDRDLSSGERSIDKRMGRFQPDDA